MRKIWTNFVKVATNKMKSLIKTMLLMSYFRLKLSLFPIEYQEVFSEKLKLILGEFNSERKSIRKCYKGNY